jgi:serine/arginine repetitive matrix protein 2
MQSSEPTSQVEHPMTMSSGPSTSENNQFPPASPARAQERSQAQASLPLLQTENPTQQAVTPPGPWKLEESYLSEPLHQVSRKRSGTDDSQQLTFGMDKEMGFTASSPISPPTMGPRQRSGNQLPPSSAQRYPELFTNTQPQNGPRGRSNSGSNMAGPGFPRTESNEFDIPGVGPPEERGRRKSSSIFKEFGNRLGRASSRDRRPSVSDSRPTTSEVVRPDGSSETNVWADVLPEKRKKRSSLLNGLRSRPSMEIASQGNEMKPENGPTVIQSQGPGPSASQNALPLPSEEERKSKAGFGPDIMKLRSARTEKWDSNGPEEQHDQNASKSRLSGLGGKVAGFAGAFRRPTMEQSNQSTASVAANDFNEEARRTSQQQAAGETHEGRGRRGSAAGMISGLLGRSSSRSRQQQQHPGQQPYGENGSHQPYAGRASMDQRPSVADTLARDPPPQATVRPVGHSPPPPEAPRKDSAATNDVADLRRCRQSFLCDQGHNT